LRQLPNLITLIRLVASPFLFWFVVHNRYNHALVVVLIAGITDWLDGYTARLLGVSNPAGVILDPLADKAMLVTLFCALAWVGLIHMWLFALVMLRDLVIVAGAILLRIFRNARRFSPSIIGKVSTFFQIVFALLALLYAAFPAPVLFWLRMAALVLTALFTFISGVGYVRLGIRMTKRPKSISA
jgi:cardiolipin synthase